MTSWIEFKLSWELFKKGPELLAAEEKQRVDQVATRQARIEQRILESQEAVGVMVPFVTLDSRLLEIRRRYASEGDYRQDLARLSMTEAELSVEVNRDLLVEAVLEKVTAATAPVSEVEAEIYFRLHPGAFERAEARRLRHILVTYNTAGEKAAGRALLEGMRGRLRTSEAFGQAALQHSQCPTALQQGEMGVVKQGQLYAELEPVAFALEPGVVSEVQESPMGLHLLWCDEVFPALKPEFTEIRERLMDKLNEKRRQTSQRQWLDSLLKTAGKRAA